MAPSHVCNYSYSYRGEMIHLSFTAKFKLSFSLMLFLLTLASALLDYQHDNPTDFLGGGCRRDDKFMNEIAWERNLKVVLRSLVDNVNNTGFYTSFYGENGDRVYGLAECRGDLNASTCWACVSNATKLQIAEECRGFSSVSIYLNACFLKYSSSNFYLELNSSDASYKPEMDSVTCNEKNVTAETWSLGWKTAVFLKTIVDQAVSSKVDYSTGTNNDELYSLAQCRRNLSMNHCTKCLNSAYNSLGNCPSDTHRAYVLYDNCILRYEGYKFYGDGTPLLSRQPSTGLPSRPINEGKTRPHLPSKLGLTIGGVVSVVMLLGLVLIWKRKIINPLHLG